MMSSGVLRKPDNIHLLEDQKQQRYSLERFAQAHAMGKDAATSICSIVVVSSFIHPPCSTITSSSSSGGSGSSSRSF